MKALVVYDTVFGNTEKIAQAIAEALRASGEVTLRRVGEAQPTDLSGVDLLVVGSPTRGFRPTPATKAYIKALPAGGLQGVRVAAFDTRIAMGPKVPGILRFLAGIFGYAADPIAKALAKKGGQQAAAPEGFIVVDSEGPLQEGELERAAAWARGLAAG